MDSRFEKILSRVNPEIMESMDVDLLEEGIIDSLQIMVMVANFESEYSIEIDPDDIVPENFETVDAIWELVSRYVKEK